MLSLRRLRRLLSHTVAVQDNLTDEKGMPTAPLLSMRLRMLTGLFELSSSACNSRCPLPNAILHFSRDSGVEKGRLHRCRGCLMQRNVWSGDIECWIVGSGGCAAVSSKNQPLNLILCSATNVGIIAPYCGYSGDCRRRAKFQVQIHIMGLIVPGRARESLHIIILWV